MTAELQPNVQDMEAHLRFLFEGVADEALIEIAYTDTTTGKLNHARLYRVDQIEAAAGEAFLQNKRGSNLYVGVCPRRPNTAPFGRAADREVLLVQMLWCDWDAPGCAENAKHLWTPFPPTLLVITGLHPHARLHGYWRIEPTTDFALAKRVLSSMAEEMNADPQVCNPGRVMRLAGTIAWPVKEGRVQELTKITPMQTPGKPIYSISELEKRFATASRMMLQPPKEWKIDTEIKLASGGSLGITTPPLDDGRERYMRDTVMACLTEYIGAYGAAPTGNELYEMTWPQYSEHVSFARPGRGADELLSKCHYAVERLNSGHLGTLDEHIAKYQAKAKSLNGSGAPHQPQITVPPQRFSVFNFTGLKREIVEEEPDYIEPGFASLGGFVCVAGPPKSMKSWFLQDMLISCATGTSFLNNTFQVPRPLKCFWLQAEMAPKLLRQRARATGFFSEAHQQLLTTNLLISDRFRMILNADGVKAVADIINQGPRPDVIAIDPLQNVFDAESEGDNTQMMTFLTGRLEPLRQLVNPDAAIILAHHTRKVAIEDMARDPFVCLRGASALRGYYDSCVVIYRSSEEGKARKVHFEMRAGVEPEPMLVELDAGRFRRADALGEITRDIAVRILNEVRQAWADQLPLTIARNVHDRSRYAPRLLSQKFDVSAKQIEMLILQWIDNKIVTIRRMSVGTKPTGLEVIGSLE
jgi:hypothetical protein